MSALELALARVARAAVRLGRAQDALVFVVERSGLRLLARHGRPATRRAVGERWPLVKSLVLGRAVLGRRSLHVRDLAVAARRSGLAAARAVQRADGVRTVIALPLLSIEGRRALGGLLVRRTIVRPFTPAQVAALRGAADRAAAALEGRARAALKRGSELGKRLR